MFEQTFIDEPGHGIKLWTIGASLLLQCLLLAGAVVSPLVFGYDPPVGEWVRHALLLVPPPPPAPAAAAPAAPKPPAPARFQSTLQAPSEIPGQVALVSDAPSALNGLPAPNIGVTRGGVAGGFENGVLGVTGALRPAVFLPARPVRIGGNVQAAKIVYKVSPVYPADAVEQGISGAVHLEAIITAAGTIREIKVINGDPLLVAAAIDAVKQWRYHPTYLNGQAVEVITQIEVFFKMTAPPEPPENAKGKKGRKR